MSYDAVLLEINACKMYKDALSISSEHKAGAHISLQYFDIDSRNESGKDPLRSTELYCILSILNENLIVPELLKYLRSPSSFDALSLYLQA